MVKYDALLCPVDKVSLMPFNMFSMQCEANDLRKIIAVNVGGVTVEVRAIQVHMLFFGLFASLVAPFGGLFASGFKRAVKIKDFANTIPGHGGFTDRMDCQILMGLFTFVWVSQFVFNNGDYNVGGVLGKVAMMSYEDKMKVFQYLNAEVMGNK
jgi:phosphatidate cytidylyltransferase